MANLTVEQRIQKARVALLNDPNWRYMGGIIMMGDTYYDADPMVTTAATDGLNEYYNTAWMSRLTDSEFKGIVLHENFHKMLRHLVVWRELYEEDPDTANIACDAVINNQYLAGKQGIALPKGAVDMPEYVDSMVWNARKIYDDLKRKGKSSEGSTDQHLWEKAKQMSPEQAKNVQAQVDLALRQAAMVGAVGANMPRSVKDMLVPEIDWRSELADFTKQHCVGDDRNTWSKPHRTYIAYDLYLPAPYSEKLGKIAIFNDASGSIGDTTLANFMGYVQQLCNEVRPDGVDIMWWGDSVVGVDRFKANELTNLTQAVNPRGGGGTVPSCMTRWLDQEKARDDYVCAIVLTDGVFFGSGVGDWGSLPVLWLVVNDRDTSPIPVGKVIKVKELR